MGGFTLLHVITNTGFSYPHTKFYAEINTSPLSTCHYSKISNILWIDCRKLTHLLMHTYFKKLWLNPSTPWGSNIGLTSWICRPNILFSPAHTSCITQARCFLSEHSCHASNWPIIPGSWLRHLCLYFAYSLLKSHTFTDAQMFLEK